MPLSCDEEFLARVQRYGRAQVPVLIRWKHKLEAGEVLSVHIYFTQNLDMKASGKILTHQRCWSGLNTSTMKYRRENNS